MGEQKKARVCDNEPMNPAEMLPTEEFAGVMAIPAQIGIAIHDGPVSGVSPKHHDALAPATHFLHEWSGYRVTCAGATQFGFCPESMLMKIRTMKCP
jgi:hypothetical protein